VRAVILAAGYATRLYPLTLHIAKPLLPVGGRPMLDHILDRIREVPDVSGVEVVTNAKFADSFRAWAAGRDGVTVHDDGTASEDDRLGAIGDVRFVIGQAGLADEDILVIAGDNLFEFSVADFGAWWRTKGEASAVALHDVGDLELARHYGIVSLAADERIAEFEEKPERPRSTLAATATYLYHRAHVPLLDRYLAEGNSPDQPGRFIAWLHSRVPVYGYVTTGDWRDVGDAEQLLAADNRLRERAGLSKRTTYAAD
jgi:glucose-1-phosphate thymidylyltransferase